MNANAFVDETVLSKLVESGSQAVAEIIDAFLESSPKHVWVCCAYAGFGSLRDVEASAHFLKGGAGSVGAAQLHALADRLETAAHAENAEEAEKLGAKVAEAFLHTAEILLAEKIKRSLN